LPSGKLTQNGLFIRAVDNYKSKSAPPELIKVYEKILPGVWSLKGYFDLIDYNVVHDGRRNAFRYILRLSDRADIDGVKIETEDLDHAINPFRNKKASMETRQRTLCSLRRDEKSPF
jgi:hypothetical protein